MYRQVYLFSVVRTKDRRVRTDGVAVCRRSHRQHSLTIQKDSTHNKIRKKQEKRQLCAYTMPEAHPNAAQFLKAIEEGGGLYSATPFATICDRNIPLFGASGSDERRDAQGFRAKLMNRKPLSYAKHCVGHSIVLHPATLEQIVGNKSPKVGSSSSSENVDGDLLRESSEEEEDDDDDDKVTAAGSKRKTGKGADKHCDKAIRAERMSLYRDIKELQNNGESDETIELLLGEEACKISVSMRR